MKKISPKQAKWVSVIILCVALVFVVVRYFIGGAPFMYAGTLETAKVILSSHVSSDVKSILVVEGDTVHADELLMELSCDTQKIAAIQIDSDYERTVELHRREHVAQAELDAITARKNNNDLQLEWCKIKSPIDGMVVTKFREIGELVAPGTTLLSVSNPYDIWAYFYVPYDVLYKLKVGQSVTGVLPEANNMKFQGRIIKISEQAEFTPKNVQTREERMRLVYGVKVQFENPELILKSGMTIESDLM